MSLLIHLVVLCGLFLVMGVLTTPPGHREWKRIGGFLGAIGLGLAMTLVGMVIVIIMLGLYIAGIALLDIGLGLFLGVISVALASGIVMFLIVQPVIQRTGISMELLTITEYYIQWFLIYVTVYQVIFEQLNGLGRIINERDLTKELNSYLSSILDPSVLIAILLPVLLSIWVAVAIAKIRLDADPGTEAAEAPSGATGAANPGRTIPAEAAPGSAGESRSVGVESTDVNAERAHRPKH
ncbi:SA1002 family membrane protein [Brevibacterium casei]|uniref:Uncharacterized protein n=1 Tax=Brevibacterium casei CIP 102111 TaxID=1255625 RepID=A0A2H1IWA5_9MICO|nr:hypothetical protein [Brevibacterium casei]QPR39613.1 hypothetical protein I6G94_01565 [Brevibacterium casei]QPR43777.1 hypothetical protein I6G93_16845 [Brevibacterium casei]SMX79272.1 hypothetical protein BC102111_01637 [Brevibacterium casei CIP 102111]